MNINKLTQKSMEAIQNCERLAYEYGDQQTGEQHPLYSLLTLEDSLVLKLVTRMGIQGDMFSNEAKQAVKHLPKVNGGGRLYISSDLSRVLISSEDEAKIMGDEYISMEHLFLSLLKHPNKDIKALFKLYNVTRRTSLRALSTIRGSQRAVSDNPEATYDTLVEHGYGLVERARDQKLDPVVSRDSKIRNIIRILLRKAKNNPVLIGEPGVGKTAIVEGLAQRTVRGDVPDGLRDRELFALDMGTLVAGAKYRGEFGERLKAVLGEVKKSDGQIILFINELHAIMGAGRTEGSMDTGNMLKPMLARGEFHRIGATTLNEYRQYVEKGVALERRFRPVMVDGPTVGDTISILRGLKERYEVFHGVKITDSALVSVATSSDQYTTDRFLPDRAVDLVDKACAVTKAKMDTMPAELDEMSRKIMQIEIEEATPRKETDRLSQDRLIDPQKELAEFHDEFASKKAQWEDKKASASRLSALREEIESIDREIQDTQQKYDLNRAAELQYGRLPELQKELQSEEERIRDGNLGLMRENVSEDEIARIISKWTGTPVAELAEGERSKALHLDEILHKRVVGQDEGAQLVTQSIIRSKAGTRDPTKPIGSFLSLGPAGVGKTGLAKALAEALFNDESNMMRIDMGECMEKHSVSCLVGAPPGCAGYDEGGQLTEAMRRKPYSVVLFDEVGKTHPSVFNVLLQVLDDRCITDSQGRTVDFKNTIIIPTSNIRSRYLLEGVDGDGDIRPKVENAVMNELRVHFRPEFLNRLDETTLFKSLTREDIRRIVDLCVVDLNKRLANRELTMELTAGAKESATDKGYDPAYGARPLKRYLQKNAEALAARIILDDGVREGSTIAIDVDEDKTRLVAYIE